MARAMSFSREGSSLAMLAVSRKARMYAALLEGTFMNRVLVPTESSKNTLR